MNAPSILVPLLASIATAFLLPPRGGDCTKTSVGLTPLSDLTGAYLGKAGGLYPGGTNAIPAAHLAAGLAETAQIVPRDAAGNAVASGKIGLVTIGMSNTTQESQAFISQANASPLKSGSVVIVDGAQGGQDAAKIASPTAAYWSTVDARVAAAGLTSAQVQAVWLKQAVAGPTLPFPQDADQLRGYLRSIVQILRAKFPNLRACYLSSRIYAGYAVTTLNPEPYAYQSAFAVRDLIEEQIGGSAALVFDPQQGAVMAPWLAWGPYLWADGLVPRSDGLVWECSDFEADGTHPGPAAEAKVGAMLLAHFLSSPTTESWFAGAPGACGVAAGLSQFGTGLGGAFGVPGFANAGLPVLGAPSFQVRGQNLPPSQTAWFVFGFLSYPDGQLPFAGGWQHVSADLIVPVAATAGGLGSVPFGAIPNVPELCGVRIYAQIATEDAGAPQGYGLSRGMEIRFGI